MKIEQKQSQTVNRSIISENEWPPKCEDCFQYGDGLCRSRPPSVFIDTFNKPESYWPTVMTHDWCGEYERRDDTEED